MSSNAIPIGSKPAGSLFASRLRRWAPCNPCIDASRMFGNRWVCRARQEVYLDELLHSYSRQTLGLSRLKLRLSAMYRWLGSCPRTAPPYHRGGRINSNTQQDTQNMTVLRNAENSRRLLQLRTNKNPNHSIVHILSKCTNPLKSCLPLRSKPLRSIYAF